MLDARTWQSSGRNNIFKCGPTSSLPTKILLLFQRQHCQPPSKGQSLSCLEAIRKFHAVLFLSIDDFFPPKKHLQENRIPWLWQVFLLSWSWLHRRLLYTSHSHRYPLWDREAHQWPGTETQTTGFLITGHWQYICHSLASLCGQSITKQPSEIWQHMYITSAENREHNTKFMQWLP